MLVSNLDVICQEYLKLKEKKALQEEQLEAQRKKVEEYKEAKEKLKQALNNAENVRNQHKVEIMAGRDGISREEFKKKIEKNNFGYTEKLKKQPANPEYPNGFSSAEDRKEWLSKFKSHLSAVINVEQIIENLESVLPANI